MQFKGLLTVVGSLDISQLWPATKGTNSSDGDTLHLKVDPNTSFLFSSSSTAKPKKTTKFAGAVVVDHNRKKKVVTAKSEIKIRLQGIDTPELHFPVIAAFHPTKRGKFKNEFRQPFGAGAAKALHDHLSAFIGAGGGTTLFATFITRIDKPNQAVDSHGRFVGDVLVGTSQSKSINTWLAEAGWAFPLFYDSMRTDEIRALLKAWNIGRKIGGRPGKALRAALQDFVPTRNVDNAKLPDHGNLNIPKIFRRQATFWSQVAGPLTPAEFVQQLKKGMKGKSDKAYPLAYFLANSAKPDRKKRIAMASKIGPQGQTLFKPEDLVFVEDASTLLDAGGKPVTSW